MLNEVYFYCNLLIRKTKNFSINMSKVILEIPIKLGCVSFRAGVSEHSSYSETYYSLVLPAIGHDKRYYLFIEPYGDTYFNFEKGTPKELLKYEGKISEAIYNYYC